MASTGREHWVEVLENIARLLELKGENPFKVRAYTNAARAVETTREDLRRLAAENQLAGIDGIGKAIAEKLTQLIETGSLPYYEELRSEFPEGLFALFDLQGLGPKKIKVLYDKLNIDSLEGLEAACRDGRVAGLEGFGEKTAVNLLKSIEFRKSSADRFHLSDAIAEATALREYLLAHSSTDRVEVAGSCRRYKETVHDLDFLAVSGQPAELMDHLMAYPEKTDVLARGETKSSIRLASGMQADLRVVKAAEFPFALCYFTGSKEHNVVLRQRALDRGWTLNEYRFAEAGGKKKTLPLPEEIHEEKDLYHALGLQEIPPELRENTGEIEAAEKGELPKLLELENLRGTFHNHTTASDGRSTLEEMADAARELGLQYLGIADHSKSQVQANGLDAKRLRQQVADIRSLNEQWDDFQLFAGVECDILRDGSLDFDDDLLGELDYVVASVHGSFGLSEAAMTGRIIRAMENSMVTMLGHPTGRLLLTRDPYQVDLRAVIEAAAETGTMIELNANPYRLDMDWRWWPLAIEKGVRCVINPDAHSIDQLAFLRIGVGMARKGWLQKQHVLNTLPLERVREVLKEKRGR